MKTLTRPLLVRPRLAVLPRLALALCALAAAPAGARAQDAWAGDVPKGEDFTVLMPGRPEPVRQQLSAGVLSVAGRRYESAGSDGAAYVVLSLRDPKGVGKLPADDGYRSVLFHRESPYLDAIAELAWEAFVRAEFDRHSKSGRQGESPSMDFRREFELSGLPAREYFIRLPKAGGPVYVAADGPRIYVVAALGPDPQSVTLKRFVDSFALRAGTSAKVGANKPPDASAGKPSVATGGGVGPGRGSNEGGGGAQPGSGGTVDYSQPFRAMELTRRAQVMSRPEPSYTASARKFGVVGTVTVRAVLHSSGEVERVVVISGLPHGLTSAAVGAARQIKFAPAEKDGRRVSQWVTIQYNFNIY